mmetsp:Transcript_45404/g.119231  ORF Transcript_45404/g.119231 Transcript_45404/m.119231 type:complete len:309 (-) Transcript_45404:45-971(-)
MMRKGPEALAPYPCMPGTWLTSARDLQDLTGSSCRQPDTLLYIGADLDVYMLTLMQPWETTAVYFDKLESEPKGEELTLMYEREHRKDPRPAWRTSSYAFRPCRYRACAEPLTRVLHDRMVQEPSLFAQVRVDGNMSISFELQRQRGIARSLRYVVGWHGTLKRWSMMAEFRGRVSTLAAPGAALNLPLQLFEASTQISPELGFWSPCARHGSLILTVAEAKMFFPSHFAGLHFLCERQLATYGFEDTLVGRRRLDAVEGPSDDEGSKLAMYCVGVNLRGHGRNESHHNGVEHFEMPPACQHGNTHVS